MEPAITAAGHEGATSGEGVFVKPTNSVEIQFYNEMLKRDSPLADICPVYMGQLEPKTEGEGKPCVVLGDVLWGYKQPNVLDVKIGSILWDEHATPEKVQRLKAVADSTTSGSLGFRIAGISLWDGTKRQQFGKMYGRDGVDASNIVDKLMAFFPESNEYTTAVREAMGQQLDEILDVLEQEPVKMHSASVLFVYEGDMPTLKERIDKTQEPEEPQELEKEPVQERDESDSDSEADMPSPILTVKLIDFGHATFTETPFDDHVKGVRALKKVWAQLVAGDSTS